MDLTLAVGVASDTGTRRGVSPAFSPGRQLPFLSADRDRVKLGVSDSMSKSEDGALKFEAVAIGSGLIEGVTNYVYNIKPGAPAEE
jgi:hypothetical protein